MLVKKKKKEGKGKANNSSFLLEWAMALAMAKTQLPQ